MRAAQLFGNKDLRVVDVDVPKRKQDDVLVAVEWSGICGTDLHEYSQGPTYMPTEAEGPHPLTGEVIPITMGHEFCGRVLEAPEGSHLKPGQGVMVDPRFYCGTCPNCKIKCTNACATWGTRGLSGGGGGFSETVAVHQSQVHAVPESMLDHAALIEPLAVSWHAVKLSEIPSFEDKMVLVLGGGPVGIALIYVLKHWKAQTIIVSEVFKSRIAHCEGLADVIVNPMEEKVSEVCRKLTDGQGVHIVFDCAGVGPAMEEGMAALRFRGTYMNVASWGTPFNVPVKDWMLKELTLKAPLSYDDADFSETVEAFGQGHFKGIEKLVSSRISVEDVAQKGFEELIHNKDKHMKILVTPRKQ